MFNFIKICVLLIIFFSKLSATEFDSKQPNFSFYSYVVPALRNVVRPVPQVINWLRGNKKATNHKSIVQKLAIQTAKRNQEKLSPSKTLLTSGTREPSISIYAFCFNLLDQLKHWEWTWNIYYFEECDKEETKINLDQQFLTLLTETTLITNNLKKHKPQCLLTNETSENASVRSSESNVNNYAHMYGKKKKEKRETNNSDLVKTISSTPIVNAHVDKIVNIATDTKQEHVLISSVNLTKPCAIRPAATELEFLLYKLITEELYHPAEEPNEKDYIDKTSTNKLMKQKKVTFAESVTDSHPIKEEKSQKFLKSKKMLSANAAVFVPSKSAALTLNPELQRHFFSNETDKDVVLDEIDTVENLVALNNKLVSLAKTKRFNVLSLVSDSSEETENTFLKAQLNEFPALEQIDETEILPQPNNPLLYLHKTKKFSVFSIKRNDSNNSKISLTNIAVAELINEFACKIKLIFNKIIKYNRHPIIKEDFLKISDDRQKYTKECEELISAIENRIQAGSLKMIEGFELNKKEFNNEKDDFESFIHVFLDPYTKKDIKKPENYFEITMAKIILYNVFLEQKVEIFKNIQTSINTRASSQDDH